MGERGAPYKEKKKKNVINLCCFFLFSE